MADYINVAKTVRKYFGKRCNAGSGRYYFLAHSERLEYHYDALKAVHDVVKGGVKVKKSIGLVADISEIYVRNYQKMLGDPNYTPDELETISFGYASRC